MQCLDERQLAALDAPAFQQARPYPWINSQGLIREQAYPLLAEQLPELEQFTASFGARRAHGQRPHDRYVLEYASGPRLGEAWQQFMAELQGPAYRRFLCRMLGTRAFFLTFHWHYAPPGCSVSPHCDAPRKLGSHIFYFNTEADWQPDWGGETLVLDDGGRLSPKSAPGFDEFDRTIASESLGNRSLLFMRRGNSWHGVRPVRCPPGRLRKVFIVVINRWTPAAVLKHLSQRLAGGRRAP